MIQLKPSGIKEIESLAQQDKDCISLSQGTNKMGSIPQSIKSYMQDILQTDKADYYENIHLTNALKEKIACSINTKHGSTVNANQVVITHGSIGAVAITLQALFDAGDEIILPEATYPVYQNIIHTSKATPVFTSNAIEQPDGTSTWGLAIEHIKQATTSRTRAILLSHPANPTGYIATKEEIVKLLAWCHEKGIYLIVDEVYEDFVFDGPFFSTAHLANSSNRLIRTSSLSKNYAMSGWRIGYMTVPHNLVEHLEMVQHSQLICPSTLGQWAAMHALDNPQLIEPFANMARINRDLAIDMLTPLASRGIISFEKPQGGFFLFIKTNHEDSRDLCTEIMKKAHVSLIPGQTFGPSCSSHMRLCYARPTHTLQEGLRRLVSFWQK
jgi:aspartate/methionine/tyrosine aminotransferase